MGPKVIGLMTPKTRDVITELSIFLLLPLIFLFLFSAATLASTGTTNMAWFVLSLTGIITVAFILGLIHQIGPQKK